MLIGMQISQRKGCISYPKKTGKYFGAGGVCPNQKFFLIQEIQFSFRANCILFKGVYKPLEVSCFEETFKDFKS